MGQMINVNIRMDEDLKKQADYLFNELGLNMSTAVNMFVRQAVRTGGIPFEVTVGRDDWRVAFSADAAMSGGIGTGNGISGTPNVSAGNIDGGIGSGTGDAGMEPAQSGAFEKACDPAET